MQPLRRTIDLGTSDGAAVAEQLGGTFHPCNVMDHEGMETIMAEAVEALGGLDFCVNTAGGGAASGGACTAIATR